MFSLQSNVRLVTPPVISKTPRPLSLGWLIPSRSVNAWIYMNVFCERVDCPSKQSQGQRKNSRSTARDLHRAHTTNRKIKPPNAKTLLFLYTKRKFKNLHLKNDIYYDHILYLRNHISSIIIIKLPSHKYFPKIL